MPSPIIEPEVYYTPTHGNTEDFLADRKREAIIRLMRRMPLSELQKLVEVSSPTLIQTKHGAFAERCVSLKNARR